MRFVAVACVAAFVIGGQTRSAQAAESEGQAVFTAQKCVQCHAVSSAGIKSDGDAPDLAGVGDRHTAEWLKAYLLKEEAKDGKKHKKKFQGSDAELAQLVTWLSSLKAAK